MSDSKILQQLSEIGAQMASCQPPKAVFHAIVDAVQSLGFDRVRLDLVSPEGSSISLAAQRGFDGMETEEPTPAGQDLDLMALLSDPCPQVTGTGERGVIPLVLRGTVIGKLTVDNAARRRSVSREELDTAVLFANQAAIAQAMLWGASLETLQTTSLAITSMRDRQTLLTTIIGQAVKLLGAQSGGLYEYHPELAEITVIADYNRPEHVGRTLKLGEGMAGRVIQERRPHMVVLDYNNWENRADIYHDERGICAVLEVPLRWEGRYIGVLYVDDKKGRSFSDIDIRLLRLFADQAAISLTNASLLQNDEDKLQRLERLAQSTRELMGNLDGMSLQERLMLIARYSAEILQAETAGVFRMHEGEIVLEASYGQEGELVPGTVKLRIHDEAEGGLTGYVAYHGKLFNAKGEELKSHFAVAGSPAHAPSGNCYSLLAIPLKKRTAETENLIGLIRVDNKKSKDGKALATLGFSAEDESILSIFAEAAAVAIESAELVDRLKERQDFQERLIASSPDAIISVDRDGLVTEFNKRAEEILRFPKEKILGTPVYSLYADREEPYRLGKMLRDSDGYVRGHETAVLSSEQERIPILQSSTWLFNARGKRTGSVGYFQDIRQRKALERRESFLLWASNVVAKAGTLDAGLQSLAERLVSLLGRSFCGILLLNEDEKTHSLTLRAASQGGDPTWSSSRQQIIPSEWPGLEKLLEVGEPSVRERSDDRAKPNLERLSRLLALPREIHSLLVVPLKIGEQVVGQLDLGNLEGSAYTGFSKDEIELVSAIASQITILIHRMELLEILQRREELLHALVQASTHIRADVESPALRQVIVRLAAELVRCKIGGLFLNLPYLGQLELVEVFNAPEELKGQHFSHSDGLIGQVAQERETRVHKDPMSEELFRKLGLKVVVAVPLRDASGEVEAVLFLGDSAKRGSFGRTDLGILEAFATQAAIALRTARLMNQEQLYFSQFAVLHRIRDYIQSTDALEKILLAVLTGVTASYGLGFNRAVLLLLEETGEQLVGEIGIGQLEEKQARSAWKAGLKDFESFLSKLERDEIKPTPVGLAAKGICLNVRGNDLFSTAVADGRLRRIAREEFSRVPSAFLSTFDVTTPLVVAPLTAKGQVLGILIVDNKFTQAPIGNDGCNVLMTFAATAAVAIDNKRFLDQTSSSAAKLFAFYQMSSELTSIQDPGRLLKAIVDQTVSAAGASWVSILLIDRERQTQNPIISNQRFAIDPWYPMPARPNGISMEVMRKGQAYRIENVEKVRKRVNPSLIERSVKAAICLPLSLPGKRIGVMWIHYNEPRRFSDSEVTALQLYVNQAAIAYDSARRVEKLDDLRASFTALTEARDLKSMLAQLVESGRRVLKADSVVFWFYDSKTDAFIPEQSVYSGQHPAAWKELQMSGPQPRGTAFRIMGSDWKSVEDVGRRKQAQEIGPNTRRFLDAIGGRSFQGIALKAGREKEGVLYVIYSQPRRFDSEERETGLTFANHAALALKKAKLFDQVERAQEAAKAVARVTLLEDPGNTLISIARETRGALGCGAVVLFKYDEETGALIHSALAGVHTTVEASSDRSLVLAMVERDAPYIITDVSRDEKFKGSPFGNAAGIKSCVALPLKAAGCKVGVMFVGYGNRRRFTGDELTHLELFANQAAVAIRNAQLFDERAAKLDQQKALADLSEQLLAVKSVQETMDRAVAFAAKVLDTEFGNIILRDGQEPLKFGAVFGWEWSRIKDLVVASGKGSQTGYTIQKREPVAVDDYSKVTDFIVPEIVTEHDIRSGLSAPMFREGEIVGAMVVHTRKLRRFTEEDKTLLSLIANQTAIALERGQQYEAKVRSNRYLSALYEASKAMASHFGSERRKILDEIVKSAVEGINDINGPKALLATLQLYDADKHELILESFYPQDLEADLSLVGEPQQIERLLRKNQRIGVTGRTALVGEPRLVPDVNADTDYVAFNPTTRSAVAVPLLDQGKVIGVLNAESELPDAFDKADEGVLQALAELAVIAIRSAQQVDELKEARQLIDTRTTLAWMGIGNVVGRHEMARSVGILQNEIYGLEKELQKLGISNATIVKSLRSIKRRMQRDLDLDVLPTGRAHKELASIPVNEGLVRARKVRIGRGRGGYVQLETQCGLDDSARVSANIHWLNRIIDILLNNAVDATEDMPKRKIILGSRGNDSRAEIYVADNGTGIPEHLRDQLLKVPIEKPKGSKGLGVGLVVAQAIAQIYGGQIYWADQDPIGTVMALSLPFERPLAKEPSDEGAQSRQDRGGTTEATA